MIKMFFVMYDDESADFWQKIVYRRQIAIYRSNKYELMEELDTLGFPATAVLMEEDVEALKNGNYHPSAVTAEDIETLKELLPLWENPKRA